MEQVEQLTRVDTLPEYKVYYDTGCNLHPHCLTCPLERCQYERGVEPIITERAHATAATVTHLRLQGLPRAVIAAMLGISERTVSRYCPLRGPNAVL